MPNSDTRASAALLSAPDPRPVFAESLPDWEFPPSFQAFAQARRRALESLAPPQPQPPPAGPSGDEAEDDTNPGEPWEEVAP